MKNLLLILPFLFAIGCAPQTKTTNLKVSLGAVTNSGNFPGGLYILARGSNGDRFVKQVPANDELEIEVANGTWSFAAVGWDSAAGAYEGSAYCDSAVDLVLTGGNFNLSLNTTKANCVNFSSIGSFDTTTSEILPLKIYSCLDIKRHLEIGERIDGTDPNWDCKGGGGGGGAGPGGDQSFKISLMTLDLNGTVAEGLQSNCIIGGVPNGNASNSNLKIPTGNTSINFPYKIQAYSSSNCATGTETGVYSFENLVNESLAANFLGQSSINTGVSTNIYLHVNRCEGAQLTNQPFALTMGSSSDYHLICTSDQFINIGQGGTQQHTFEIGKDLDFASASNPSEGTFSYVPGTFRGEIRGQFKKLKNGDKALFDTYSAPTSGNSTYTGNIFIENFDIAVTGVSNNSYGIFANQIDNTTSNDLEVGDIVIDANSTITVNGDVPSYVGGFVGKMNHNSSGSRSYIRHIQSLADVSVSNTTEANQYVGGIVGKVFGNTGGTFEKGAYLEYASVGKASIPYINYSDTRKVLVSGYHNVGGIAGSVYGGEVRGLIEANTKLEAYSDAGGIIGSMDFDSTNNHFDLKAAVSKVELVPRANPSTNFGGIIGSINQTVGSSAGTFLIAASNADVLVQSSANSINKLGGIVGDLYSSNYGDVYLSNVKSRIRSLANGDYHGGFFGKYFVSSVNAGFMPGAMPAVSNSVTVGYIGNNSSTGNFRGGIVGWGKDLDVFRTIASTDIYGSQNLGGGYGFAEDSIFFESHIDSLVYSGTGSSLTFTGGVAGQLTTNVNRFDRFTVFSKVDVDIDLNTDVTDCYGGRCGLIVGDITNGDQNSALAGSSIIQGVISDDVGGTPSAMSYVACGSDGGTICSGMDGEAIHVNSQNGSPTADTGSCSGVVGAPFIFHNSKCQNLFAKRWEDFGFTGVTDDEYLAGNPLEPFEISSATEWDSISDDSFLMAKSFELTNNISFGGAPNPIGSNMNPFTGAIASGEFSLQNITTNHPVFRVITDSAIIGNEVRKLKVDGFNLNCGGQSNCGFVGALVPGMGFGGSEAIFNLEISGGDVSGSNACLGGFIGNMATSVRIERSGFSGIINSSGNGVGGMVGCMSQYINGSGGSFDIRANIDESYVDADQIIGGDYVGGFIGNVPYTSSSTTYIEVRDSYLVLDKNDVNSGNDIDGSSYKSGIVGSIDLSSNGRFEVKRSYVDTSTADLPAGYAHITRSIAGTRNGNHSAWDFALIWNSTRNGSESGYHQNFSNGSDLSFVAASAPDLADQSNEFEASTDGNGHSWWWFDPNDPTKRVLQLEWEDPNYVD